MTRLEIAVQLLTANLRRSPFATGDLEWAMNAADELVKKDNTPSTKKRVEYGQLPGVGWFTEEKTAAKQFAELAVGRASGLTPNKKKANFLERLFSGGGE